MAPLSSEIEKNFKKFFWKIALNFLPAQEAKRVPRRFSSALVFRPDHLGDFVLSTAAIRTLQEHLGRDCRLTLVCGTRNERVARALFPDAAVLVAPRSLLLRFFFMLRLSFGNYDLAMDLHSFPFSTTCALMVLFSRSPVRVGFWAGEGYRGYRAVSEKIYNLGLEPPSPDHPEGENGSLLVRRLFPTKGKPRKARSFSPVIPKSVVSRVSGFFEGMGMGSGVRVLGIHPTLRKRDNGWSRDRFVQLARELSVVGNLRIVVVHGIGELEELARFQEALGKVPRVFALPENDVLFILEAAKRFDGFVCNDAGLMHLVSLVAPVWAIFGPSNPRRWGPMPSKVLKPLVFRGKEGRLDSIQVGEVVGTVLERLRLTSGSRKKVRRVE